MESTTSAAPKPVLPSGATRFRYKSPCDASPAFGVRPRKLPLYNATAHTELASAHWLCCGMFLLSAQGAEGHLTFCFVVMRAAEKPTRISPPHRDLAAGFAQDALRLTHVFAPFVSVKESLASTNSSDKYFPQSVLQGHDSYGRATVRPSFSGRLEKRS